MEKLPLPYESDSVDEILLLNVLEHLWLNPYVFMVEMCRIMKKDAVIKIELPVVACQIGHVRWFHKRNYFDTITVDWHNNSFQNDVMFRKKVAKYKVLRHKGFPWFSLHVYFELVKL